MTQVQTMMDEKLEFALADLEVQAKAIEVDAREYVRNLQELKWECSFSGISMKKAAELLTASPRERAEAAYITLSSKQ